MASAATAAYTVIDHTGCRPQIDGDPRAEQVRARVESVVGLQALQADMAVSERAATIGEGPYLGRGPVSSATLTIKGAQIAVGSDKRTDQLHYAAMDCFAGCGDRPQGKFNVTFARSVNHEKWDTGNFNRVQFYRQFRAIVRNALTAQIENGAKEIVWNPFGMGAFIRPESPTARGANELRNMMAKIVVDEMKKKCDEDLRLRVHLCLFSGGDEAQANYTAFEQALNAHNDEPFLHQVTVRKNADMLEVAQCLANQGKAVDMIIAGNRHRLGNHWMNPRVAMFAQEEGGFRRMKPEFLARVQQIHIEKRIGVAQFGRRPNQSNDRNDAAMRNRVLELMGQTPAPVVATTRQPQAPQQRSQPAPSQQHPRNDSGSLVWRMARSVWNAVVGFFSWLASLFCQQSV